MISFHIGDFWVSRYEVYRTLIDPSARPRKEHHDMNRNQTEKPEQKNQAEQKDKAPIIRVRSGLRAGETGFLVGCYIDGVAI
jgi:hypothetical protein